MASLKPASPNGEGRHVSWAVLVSGIALCSAAFAVPDSFALSDDAAGPTCLSYTGMGDLSWSRAGGDWVDASGALYGEKAFATLAIPRGKERFAAEWEVTELVSGWLGGKVHNAGLMLRVMPGKKSGTVDFHSRESADPGLRPSLILSWSDGSQTRVQAAADTYLSCSSRSSKGGQPVLKVSGRQIGFLRFAVANSGKVLQRAMLQLVSDRRYGADGRIGVYRAAPSYIRLSGEPTYGLAGDVAIDVGIEKNPDVIFATGFERTAWATEWGHLSPRSVADTVTRDPARKFEPLSGRALRVRLPKGENLGLDLRYEFARGGQPEPEEVYFRYYLRFADDWNPSRDGGKMPGIAGTYGRAGWGMRKSDGYNGWSVRGSFAQRPANAKSVEALTATGSYAYHTASGVSGDHWPWSGGPSGLLQNNRWYAVEQYVKLNTVGARDGVFRAWIDGRQVAEKVDIQFRNTRDLKIETVWLNIYHGGVAPSPHDMTLYIDNVVIARRYIGPIKP